MRAGVPRKLAAMAHDPQLAFLAGDSALARQIREADWSRSPLGPPEQWPQSLRSVVNVLLGSAFPMFVAWGPQLGMVYNDAYAEILGRKHPASLGAPFEEVWADIHHDIMPFVRRALAGEAFFVEDLPLRMQRRGFEEDTWFTFSYSPVRDESGQIAGFYCACSETTKAVLVQRQLRAREEWLTSLFHRAPGFAAVLRGPDHVFDMVNESYRQITGQRTLIGMKLADALPEIVDQGFGTLLDQVFETGEPYIGRSVPVTVAQPDGRGPRHAYVDFMYQPLRDAQGRVEAIFVQGHDVTELHRAQEVLRSADRQKDQFLATLAHELRNPLAPIRTRCAAAGAPGGRRPRCSVRSPSSTRQVRHMSRLLDDLIDIVAHHARRLELQKGDVALGDVVEPRSKPRGRSIDVKRHTVVAQVDSPDARIHLRPGAGHAGPGRTCSTTRSSTPTRAAHFAAGAHEAGRGALSVAGQRHRHGSRGGCKPVRHVRAARRSAGPRRRRPGHRAGAREGARRTARRHAWPRAAPGRAKAAASRSTCRPTRARPPNWKRRSKCASPPRRRSCCWRTTTSTRRK